MTRFSGNVGFSNPARSDGVTKDVITERPYVGDKETDTRYFANAESVLGKISFQTRISIMADPYALENWTKIRYVEWAGAKMIVESVKHERPRLTLVLGGVYNGEGPAPIVAD